MTDGLLIAAFVRRLMTHLLVALLAVSSLGTVSTVFAAGDPCVDEDCPCDTEAADAHVDEPEDVRDDDCHDCDAPCGAATRVADADADRDEPHDTRASDDPCRTDCDDCQCSVSTAHIGVVPRASSWRPACAGLDLEHRAALTERPRCGPQSRLERPPRSPLS